MIRKYKDKFIINSGKIAKKEMIKKFIILLLKIKLIMKNLSKILSIIKNNRFKL